MVDLINALKSVKDFNKKKLGKFKESVNNVGYYKGI